jgi:hypothetical protein
VLQKAVQLTGSNAILLSFMEKIASFSLEYRRVWPVVALQTKHFDDETISSKKTCWPDIQIWTSAS